MSRAAVSLDARWYRSSPTGWGLPSRGSAHNILVQAVSNRPATRVELADLHRGKSPCLASSDCAHSKTPRTAQPAKGPLHSRCSGGHWKTLWISRLRASLGLVLSFGFSL